MFKIILNYKLHVYLVSSIQSFNYGPFFTRPCLKVIAQEHAISSNERQGMTSKKFRYSNLIIVVAHEEAETQEASLQKKLFEIAQLKTLTTKY